MNQDIYDPVEQPTLYAMYRDIESNPSSDYQPDMWGLLHTIQDLDKTIERIQQRFVADVCMKYEDKYLLSAGQMVLHLTEAVRHAAIRLEQVPDDLRGDVESACHELERLIK